MQIFDFWFIFVVYDWCSVGGVVGFLSFKVANQNLEKYNSSKSTKNTKEEEKQKKKKNSLFLEQQEMFKHLRIILLLLAALGQCGASVVNCGGRKSGDTRWWYCRNRLGFPSYEDVYEFTIEKAKKVTLDTCGSAFDTVVYVYDRNFQFQYAMNNDSPTCGAQAYMETFLEAGDYYIVIEGTSRAGGYYELDVGCQDAECQAPNIPNSNAGFACDGTERGGQCNFECDDGYESTNGLSISCNLGGLWNALPQCVGVECEGTPFNPNSNTDECPTKSAGEFCQFECDGGYRPKNGALPIVMCGADGQWGTPPECEPVPSCDAPDIPFSDAVECDGKPEGELCDVHCYEGYVINGNNRIFCEEGGFWEWEAPNPTTSKPVCEEVIVCGAPVVEHSSLSINCAGTPAGMSCPYGCDSGYAVEGDDFPILHCQADGTWNYDILPPCTEALRAAPVLDEDGDGVDDIMEKVTLAFEQEIERQLCAAIFDEPEKCDDLEYRVSGLTLMYDWEGVRREETECYDKSTICDLLFEGAGGKDVGCIVFTENCAKSCDACDQFDWFVETEFVDPTKFAELNVQPHRQNDPFFDSYRFLLENVLQLGDDVDDAQVDYYQGIVHNVTDDMNVWLTEQEASYRNLCKFFAQYQCPSSASASISTVEEDFMLYLENLQLLATLESFEREIQEANDRLWELQNTPVGRLRRRIQDDLELYSVDDSEGNNHPNWFNNPTPDQLVEDFAATSEGLLEMFISLNTNSNFTTEYTETSAQSFVAKNAGDYYYMRFEEENIDFKMNLTINKWALVNVDPAEWYDDTWSFLVSENGEYFNSDAYRVEEESGSDTPFVFGDGGIMNSVVRQLVVAEQVDIKASFKASMTQEEIRIWNNSSTSVQLPGMCTQDGQACVQFGTVFIGGDAPQHGSHVAGENLDGWKFMEHITSKFMQVLPVGEEKYEDLIVGLGTNCAGTPFATPNDAGEAIFYVANVLDLNATCFDGASGIRQFWDMYNAGKITPRMIYLPGNGLNALTEEEGAVLELYASNINEYVARGGGLMAFGSGDISLGWLKKLLPDLVEELECDITTADITSETSRKIDGLSEELVRGSGGCSSHFSSSPSSFGGLTVIAVDSEERNFMFSGISIQDSSEENTLQSGNMQSFIETDPNDPARLIMTVKMAADRPQVIAKYAPRFHLNG